MKPARSRRRLLRTIAIILGSLLLVLLVGPFLVPVPPIEDAVPARALADPDSEFIPVNGLDVHVKRAGAGPPTFLLLHGFASSTFTWRHVLDPLAASGAAIAFDRPASGLTERRLAGDYPDGRNPYTREAQVDLAVGLLDALGVDRAILVGNSAGGTVATEIALAHPERVAGLILVDPAIYSGGGAPPFVRPLLNTPQMRRLGPLIARRLLGQNERLQALAWHDPSLIDDATRANTANLARIVDWDRALWEFTLASDEADFTDRLPELTLPVLVITGADDRIVPPEESARLAAELPNATLVTIPACGHVPQEECPDAFLAAVADYVAALGAAGAGR